MSEPLIRMDSAALNAFLRSAFPEADAEHMPSVVEVEAGRVLLKLPYLTRQLRPGGVISGPTLMTLADTAAYALVLAHIGEVAMAVTTSNLLIAGPPAASDWASTSWTNGSISR